MVSGDLNNEKKSKKSKALRLVFFVILIFVISGISSLLADKYVFPWLAARKGFEKSALFKKAMENVTVINKTEQMTVNESRDISGYTEKSASSVVEIVSKQKKSAFSGAVPSESGIIVTADGLVASYNNNFFDGKDAQYQVFSADGKSYTAQIVANDPFSNILLLKLDNAQNLPVAEFIAPEDIKAGMKMALVGRSGFNAEISLRTGITSEWAKSFSVAGPFASSEKLQGVLLVDLGSASQWDGTLAGGAAVDQNGNVIGIYGQRKDDSNVFSSFIVPVNHLRYVTDQYVGKGNIQRASLGVYYVALSKETAYLAGNNLDRGALIFTPSGQQGLAVISGSAADKAGIKIGDVILSVNGEDINPDQNLAYLISKYKPGDTAKLHISRSGQEMDIDAALQ